MSSLADSLSARLAAAAVPAVGFALPVVGACSPVHAPSVEFVPSCFFVGSRRISSSAFLPAASGVVSSLSWDEARGAVVCVVGGVRLLCLCSGLGGVGSPGAVSLVAALRAARSAGVPVDLWGAPGSSGRVCPGYFCAVSAA